MNLKYYTVSELLLESLKKLMAHPAFDDFVLVGGTALSLQLGHRQSIDIDLFTCQPYGTLSGEKIKEALSNLFEYTQDIDSLDSRNLGYSVYIGKSKNECVKLDMYYTEPFIAPIVQQEGLRLASIEDIAAMKMLAIVTGNRKKDFWDIHELLNQYSLHELIQWGLKRNPYTLNENDILSAFDKMEDMKEDIPIQCLKGKYWEFVKEDINESILHYQQQKTKEL